MAAKTDDSLKILKSKIQEGKVLIGTERVLKGLRQKEVSHIFLAHNCKQSTKEEIQHYAALVNIPVTVLPQNNEELGVFCKKNFFVSALAIVGE